MSENRDVAYLLLDLADDYPRLAAVHRRAARLLLTGPGHAGADTEAGCQRCGAAIENLERGRPRKFCTDCSPRRKVRKKLP